jgi:hypothetical protein
LQRRGDTVGNVRRFEVAGDNGQLAVAGAVIEGREFHVVSGVLLNRYFIARKAK